MITRNIILICAAIFALSLVPTASHAQDPGNWTIGWTAYLNDNVSNGTPCPDVEGVSPRGQVPSDGTCTLSGTITDDLSLHSGYDWLLDGAVFIGTDVGPDGAAADGDPATITIGAGTHVLGASPNSFLVISRGSKIYANGTKSAPVIFASEGFENENLDTSTGTWGGLIINGRSQCNCSTVEEGAGTGDGEVGSGRYGGGTSPVLNDSSGGLHYVRILYAGYLVNDEQELNGIAFQGVGSGTSIDHIQVHNGLDDAMEFFGGTVHAKYLVLTGSADDGFDWTSGFAGRAQYVIVIQNELTDASGDPRGIEADNLEANHDALPRSMPMLSNFTLVGPPGDSAWPGNVGMLLRRGTGAHLMNVVVSDFESYSLDIDDAATYAQATAGNLTFESVLLGDNSQGGVFASDADDATIATVFDSGGPNHNIIATPSLQAPAGGGKTYVNGATENGMTATDPTARDAAFFAATDHVGAVKNDADDWTAGWTVWLKN